MEGGSLELENCIFYFHSGMTRQPQYAGGYSGLPKVYEGSLTYKPTEAFYIAIGGSNFTLNLNQWKSTDNQSISTNFQSKPNDWSESEDRFWLSISKFQ